MLELINVRVIESDAHLNSTRREMLMRGWGLRADKVVRSIDRCWVSKRGSTDAPSPLVRDEVYRVTFFIKRPFSARIFIIRCRQRVITVSLKLVSCDQLYCRATLTRNYEKRPVSSIGIRFRNEVFIEAQRRISSWLYNAENRIPRSTTRDDIESVQRFISHFLLIVKSEKFVIKIFRTLSQFS